jgi:hypothetical protein
MVTQHIRGTIATRTWYDRNTYVARLQHIRGTIETRTWNDRDSLEINACSMNDDARQNLRPLIITYLSVHGSYLPLRSLRLCESPSSREDIFSRQAAKTCIPRGAFAFFAPLREDKLQIINDPTYVTILQPSTVKIYE